jgi:hypothetical protein
MTRWYPAQTAQMIASRLREDCTPATDLLAELSGQQVTMNAAAGHACWLTGSDQELLHRGPGTAWGRNGKLVTADGTVVAHTRLILIPAMVPAGALREIKAGASCGTVLGPPGMTRQDRAAAVTGMDPAVISSAVLMLKEVIGLAYECITADCCRLVAAKTALRRTGLAVRRN